MGAADMTSDLYQPISNALFPALTAKVIRESIGVIAATLAAALLVLSLTLWSSPETVRDGTPAVPTHFLFT